MLIKFKFYNHACCTDSCLKWLPAFYYYFFQFISDTLRTLFSDLNFFLYNLKPHFHVPNNIHSYKYLYILVCSLTREVHSKSSSLTYNESVHRYKDTLEVSHSMVYIPMRAHDILCIKSNYASWTKEMNIS